MSTFSNFSKEWSSHQGIFLFFFKHLLTTRQTICASHFQEEHPASIQRHDGEKKEKKVSTSQNQTIWASHLQKEKPAKEIQYNLQTEACKRNSTQHSYTGMQGKCNKLLDHHTHKKSSQLLKVWDSSVWHSRESLPTGKGNSHYVHSDGNSTLFTMTQWWKLNTVYNDTVMETQHCTQWHSDGNSTLYTVTQWWKLNTVYNDTVMETQHCI